MSAQSSRTSSANLRNVMTLTSYMQESSDKPLQDCILTLRESPRKAVWLGGYNIQLRFLKAKAGSPDVPFEIDYYRQRRRSSRSSHLAQRLRGVFYRKNNRTYVMARASFTVLEMIGFWALVVLTVVSVGVLIYTRNIVMWILIGMAGSFLLAFAGVLWLDRFWLMRIVRRAMTESVSKIDSTK